MGAGWSTGGNTVVEELGVSFIVFWGTLSRSGSMEWYRKLRSKSAPELSTFKD